MNIIKSRSPFIISVNEALQIGARIELRIWHNGQDVPLLATKTLSKLIPSPTQLKLDWNISQYLDEAIDIINAVKSNSTVIENNNNWVYCKVKRYKLIGSTYTALDEVLYVCVKGFNDFMIGNQVAENSLLKVLNNNLINSYYNKGINETPYVNIVIDKVSDKTLTATYERNDGVVYSVVQNLLAGQVGIFNLKVPLTLNPIDGNFANGCKLTLSYQTSGAPIVNIFNTYPTEECKYTPVECSFINSKGGWQFLTFFKAQTNSISVKGSNYNLMPSEVGYNPLKGQSKAFNINGSQTIKLNTGFIDENNNELIKDLMLSETVLLDNKPVKLKTQSLTYKTHLKDKNINFEVEFEYSFDLINNYL
jgi:hypothetical protein